MVLWYNKTKKGGVTMADSKLRDLSTDFAVKVLKMCDGIKGHYSLVNQLERSSTSIGANIREANIIGRSRHHLRDRQTSLKKARSYERAFFRRRMWYVN